MSATCDATAERLSAELGFTCSGAHPIITLRNPFELANWTLPVLEITIVAGAILALWYAVQRHRREADPTNLALWAASLVYLFLIEPPLYFPQWFGLADTVGFMFAHNVFTVQFMYDRLPLYIVAFYPALSQVAYEIVRRLGIFASRGPLAGAVCVAFVYQVFYEVFDQLGPQQSWWAWNLDNPANHPLLASVPMNSIWIFASVSFGVLTYVVVRLVGQPTWRGRPPTGWSLVWRLGVAGVLATIGMVVGNIPTAVVGRDVTAQAIVLTIEVALLWLAGSALVVRQWRQNRASSTQPGQGPWFLRTFATGYLTVLGVLWIATLPAFYGAVDGRTSAGTPTGNLPYTSACFLAAALVLTSALFRPGAVPAATHPVARRTPA